MNKVGTTPPKPQTIAVAAAIDAALVLVFALIGRQQHGEALTVFGIWDTAWPFLAGLAVVWVLAFVWRNPLSTLGSGVVVWLGTVAIGMLFRVLFTSGGAATAFVVVALIVLGLMLVGWRLAAKVLRGRGAVTPDSTPQK